MQRNIERYIEEGRATCTTGRHLVLSEFQELFDHYYLPSRDPFSLLVAGFYLGFTVGYRQKKAEPCKRRKPGSA